MSYERFLLDTNVLSEFNRRGDPDRLVKHWLETAGVESLYVSVLTFGEIRLGIDLLPTSRRRTQLEEWLEGDLRDWFEAGSYQSMSRLKMVGCALRPSTVERAPTISR